MTTLFHNDHTLLITSCSAIISVLTSSIVYFFQELTLEAWRISPDMVGNIAERRSLLYIIVFSAIYYAATIIMQMFFQYKLLPFASIYHLKRQSVKAMQLIRTQPHFSKKNRKRINKLIKERKKIYTNVYLVLTPTIIPPLFLVILWITIPFLLINKGLTFASIISIIFNIIFIVFTSIVTSFFAIPKEIKEIKADKKNIINNHTIMVKASNATAKITRKAFKRPLRLDTMDIVVTLIFSIIATITICFVSGPLSVHNQKKFWITKIDDTTYVIPYVTDGEAVVKLAEVHGDKSIKIYLNSQMRVQIDNKLLQLKEFDSVDWSEESL